MIAYAQLMDDFDPQTGSIRESRPSFMSMLVKQGIIKRRTAFFDPLGYSSILDPLGDGVGSVTLGKELNPNDFQSKSIF